MTAKKTRVSDETAMAADFWTKSLQEAPSLIKCAEAALLPGSGAADAWADVETSGVGGWWSIVKNPQPQDIYWFRLEVLPSDFPPFFQMSRLAQSDISFYEALAQAILANARLASCQHAPGVVGLRQWCDNMPAVGASAKLFSSKAPMCFAMQALSHVCTKWQADATISHLAGSKNIWADKLSRFREPKSQDLFQVLDPSKEVKFDLSTFVKQVWGK
ncbi:unnamed protein product [Polarella glacialis]|uniref:Uncharacterized protein n=1 Tax=Polarella glacialis TaxID=89957 RepID=A0A813FHN9_POLGL|nr:unnamed protein product [Polarella glacialis]